MKRSQSERRCSSCVAKTYTGRRLGGTRSLLCKRKWARVATVTVASTRPTRVDTTTSTSPIRSLVQREEPASSPSVNVCLPATASLRKEGDPNLFPELPHFSLFFNATTTAVNATLGTTVYLRKVCRMAKHKLRATLIFSLISSWILGFVRYKRSKGHFK